MRNEMMMQIQKLQAFEIDLFERELLLENQIGHTKPENSSFLKNPDKPSNKNCQTEMSYFQIVQKDIEAQKKNDLMKIKELKLNYHYDDKEREMIRLKRKNLQKESCLEQKENHLRLVEKHLNDTQ